ncbi:glycosyltransferase family 2 protein [Paenibacillus sp. sgz500958]|uniref:glycosyltransferase family 2 protein n=1 Tax=Paenibacillus sp. sgz500958 TaxID=3242475 RepID=UPI0036D21DB1
MVDYSKELQRARDELLHRLTSYGSLSSGSIGTLTEVVHAYSEGRASLAVLYFYLAEQFDIGKEELLGLVKDLVEIRNRSSEGDNKVVVFRPLSGRPKVSVIITTYNRKEFLNQAIQSILVQDYPNKEITVIDDCSTDGTDAYMQSTFGDDPRVIYMRNGRNNGPGNNRRAAFAAHGDGEYILFLDDDDYLIDRSYLSRAVEFHLLHPGLSFVAANVFLENTKTGQLTVASLGLPEIVGKQEYFMNFEKKGYPKPASTLTTLFKRKVLLKMDILHMKMVNDASIYLRSLLIGDPGFMDVIAGVYRIHGNNITFNLSQGFLIENLEEKLLIRNMAIEQYGYSKREMNQWFNHTAYDTISYYLVNSAKSPGDFAAMYHWTRSHCPNIYDRIKRDFRVKFMKKQILSVPLFRTLLRR